MALAAIVILVITIGIVTLWLCGHETRTAHYIIQLGGASANVTIVWYLPWHLSLGNQYLSRLGDDEYRTSVELGNGKMLKCVTSEEPKAIWQLQGDYYIACYDDSHGWVIARLESSGKTVRISRKELPPGDRPWNLVPVDAGKEYNELFEGWAK